MEIDRIADLLIRQAQQLRVEGLTEEAEEKAREAASVLDDLNNGNWVEHLDPYILSPGKAGKIILKAIQKQETE